MLSWTYTMHRREQPGGNMSDEILDAIAAIPAWDINDWSNFAECGSSNDDRFHASKKEQQEAIRDYCGSCLVRTQCLEYALSHSDVEGAWGGQDADTLMALRSRRNRRR